MPRSRAPAYVDGLLFDRRARRLVERASRAIAAGGKIPGQVLGNLPRAVLNRIAEHYSMRIDATGRARPQKPSAAGLETAA